MKTTHIHSSLGVTAMVKGGCLTLLIFAALSFQDVWSGETRTVVFQSQPPGAQIYELTRGSVSILDKTPCELQVTFSAVSSSKQYYLRKLGYKTARVTVRKGDGIVRVSLEKKELFHEASPKADDRYKAVQAQVFRVLSQEIYGDNLLNDKGRFAFAGKIGVIEISGTYYLEVGILLDDSFRNVELRRIARIQNEKEKQDALVRAVLGHSGGGVLVALGNELRSIEHLKGIALTIYYRKTKSVLGEDSDRFTQHTVSSWQVSDTIYEKHIYHTQDVVTTKVEDVEDVRAVVIKSLFRDVPSDPSKCCETILSKSDIYVNDNRQRAMEHYAKP
jgi:hypothetical protein